MKEFKLIPLNEVELCVSEKHSKPSHTKNENNVLNVGNDDFNDVMKNLMAFCYKPCQKYILFLS